MAIKKSQLYSTLWASCDQLRGGMDGGQYKDYVLALLFMKYVTDKYFGDEDGAIQVPEGGSFKDMVALKDKIDIGDGINKVIHKLAEANNLRGVIDIADFNDENLLGKGKDMVERLTKLVAIFERPDLDFSKNRAEGDDLLGDAYEYLMRNFATESGKSKGQFYTPAEVSRVMAKVVGIRESKSQEELLYDPTCGSGALLLKAADEAPNGITVYGQEMDVATTALCRMNMILHNQPAADIAPGGDSTLSTPRFVNEHGKLKQFDYVVANPPFSFKAWSTGFNPGSDEFDRFTGLGIPPQKNGDFAFLLHILKSLKNKGKGACILPHGVLFRGNAEGTIRTNLIKRGVIKGIIGLPANLFYGTGIPACILVLDKAGATEERPIFMIDASKGFVKDGNKNRLRHQDVHRIVDVFTKQTEHPRYSRLVPYSDIEKNSFNLNLPRYIDSSDPEDLQDIDCHLNGGIPERDVDELDRFWTAFSHLRGSLFEPGRKEGVVNLRVPIGDVKKTIHEDAEFQQFGEQVLTHLSAWEVRHRARLEALHEEDHPKQVIHELSEDLLAEYLPLPLVNAYNVYQHLMSYWTETMQDDAYLVAMEGWVATPEYEKGDSGKWDCDLVPKHLVIARYFAEEQAALDDLVAVSERAKAALEELEEEHGGYEGVLKDVGSEKAAKLAEKECIQSIWESISPEKNGELRRVVQEMQVRMDELAAMDASPAFAFARNAKGAVQLKALKEAVKADPANADGFNARRWLDLRDAMLKRKEVAEALIEELDADMARALSDDPDNEEWADLLVIRDWMAMNETAMESRRAAREAEAELDAKVLAKYDDLSADEIKVLVIEDKWYGSLRTAVGSELDRLAQALTARVRTLGERYETTLPRLEKEVEALSSAVEAKLRQMGFAPHEILA